MVNAVVVWLHILGPYWCLCVALFGSRMGCLLNSVSKKFSCYFSADILTRALLFPLWKSHLSARQKHNSYATLQTKAVSDIPCNKGVSLMVIFTQGQRLDFFKLRVQKVDGNGQSEPSHGPHISSHTTWKYFHYIMYGLHALKCQWNVCLKLPL